MDEVAAMAMSTMGNIVVGDMNRRELKKQREWTEDMYNKYNSPQAIINNMIAAGMNPNAAMQAISGTPASLQPTTAQPFAGNLGSEAINAYYNAKLANAQEKNIEADTKYTESKTEGQDIENQWSPQMYENTIQQGVARAFNLNANSGKVLEETRELKELFPTQKEMANFKLEQVKTDVSILKKELDHWDEKFDLEYNRVVSEIGENNANAAKANKEAMIDQFILDHGYPPGSPEAKLIKEAVSDEPDVAKKAQKQLETIGEVKNEIELENKRQDPQFRAAEEAENDYKKEVKYWDKEIDRLEKELDEYSSGRKKGAFGFKVGNLRNELKHAQEAKQAARGRYYENLHRIKNNQTESTHIFGVGRSTSK